MTVRKAILNFYSRPGAMTSAGKYAALLERLPNDVAALVRIVQGLTLHEFVASSLYGVALSEHRKSESHIREVERMLDRLLSIDGRSLDVARPPEGRLVAFADTSWCSFWPCCVPSIFLPVAAAVSAPTLIPAFLRIT